MIAATSLEATAVGIAFAFFGIAGACMLFDIGGFAQRTARQAAEAVSRGTNNSEISFYPTTPGAARFMGGCIMVASIGVIALVLTGNTGTS